MAVLAAIDLYRFYHTAQEETRALRGISFAVEAGEFVALVGPSGSGKSTLLACLAGLDTPDGGQVELLGERIARLTEQEKALRRQRYIGVVMQSGNLFGGLTAEENVRIPMLLAGNRQTSAAALAMLRRVGLAERGTAMPAELSGGEAARVGFASALVTNPTVLIADEPTAEVDAATEEAIIGLIVEHCGAGASALVATHSNSLAAAADRVISIQDGRIDGAAG